MGFKFGLGSGLTLTLTLAKAMVTAEALASISRMAAESSAWSMCPLLSASILDRSGLGLGYG